MKKTKKPKMRPLEGLRNELILALTALALASCALPEAHTHFAKVTHTYENVDSALANYVYFSDTLVSIGEGRTYIPNASAHRGHGRDFYDLEHFYIVYNKGHVKYMSQKGQKWFDGVVRDYTP